MVVESQTKLLRVDGIKWQVSRLDKNRRTPVPICPDHDLRLKPIPPRSYHTIGYRSTWIAGDPKDSIKLKCAEGHEFELPRKYGEEREYVLDRMDAMSFRKMQVLNLDDEAVPIAKEKVSLPSDSNYFLTAQLMESKRGLQVVIYAGEKGHNNKAQIFVEPEVRRLSFDQWDLNPSDLFAKIEVTFKDGTTHTIEG